MREGRWRERERERERGEREREREKRERERGEERERASDAIKTTHLYSHTCYIQYSNHSLALIIVVMLLSSLSDPHILTAVTSTS